MTDLPPLPGALAQPTDQDGPVFDEAWEARAFAMVWRLSQDGHFEWKDWVECLSRAIAQAPDRPYYLSWLSAAETLFQSAGLIETDEFAARLDALTGLEPGHDHTHLHSHHLDDHPSPAAD